MNGGVRLKIKLFILGFILCVLTLTPLVSACIDPPSGMVSWWPGDGNADDVVGVNDGTMYGATFAPGKVDQAFSFDGNSEIWASATNIDDLQELTIDAWVKLDSLSDTGYFVMIRTPPLGTKTMLRHLSDDLHFYMYIDGGRDIQVNDVLQTGVFHHVAGTYDGSVMRLYLDGVEVGNIPISGTVRSGNRVELGSGLDGLLDEVEIYNRALSAEEIEAIYNAGSEGKCKVDTDGDGIVDQGDNCPDAYNPDQNNSDTDEYGDVCDNCWSVDNPNQDDTDEDCVSLAKDPSYWDGTKWLKDPHCGDECDNCPDVWNPDQADNDQMCFPGPDICFPPGCGGVGFPCDYCEPGPEVCLDYPDEIGDVCDNCPFDYNPDQNDADGDTIGDVCDECSNDPEDDADDDGFCADVDNCPSVWNPSQSDMDNDGIGDACDDWDGDGVTDDEDNCPYDWNPSQTNSDGDDFGDVCDNCPLVASPDQTDEDNIAFQKTVTASAEYSDRFPASAVVDNIIIERKQEGYWLLPDDEIGWVQVDLGGVKTIVKIRWLNTHNAHYIDRATEDYHISLSNDTVNFVQITAGTMPFSAAPFFNWYTLPTPISARYVRFYVDSFHDDGGGLNELQVYATVGDGLGNPCDNCVFLDNPDQANADGDDFGDVCDNCPNYPNDQFDWDDDGLGDECDCDDGIKAGPETGIDCGGICLRQDCCDNLYWDIDLGETDLDCGGPCPACVHCTWCTNVTPIRVRHHYSGHIDIVFVPHWTYRNNWAEFESEVYDKIRNGYLMLGEMTIDPIPADYRYRYNFYIHPHSFAFSGTCSGVLPTGFWENASFTDTAAILSRTNEGCASGLGPQSKFITYAKGEKGLKVLMHESGHAVLGLVDEYCGNTHYEQNDPFPNVWSSLENCQDDAAIEGWTTGNCRQIQKFFPNGTLKCSKDYWRYDPDEPNPDYMRVCGFGCTASYEFGEACTRHINYMFDNWPEERSRGILVNFNINNDTITELESKVVDAHPDIGLQYEHFRAEALSSAGELLNEWGIWDPRIELGADEIGPGLVYTDNVNFTLIFPFYDNLKTFDIKNVTTGETLVEVDLTETLQDFCDRNNYQDPDCQTLDLDDDGVLDYIDKCLNTEIPESVPTGELGVNRFALVDEDNVFDTVSPEGKGPQKSFTIIDTFGCSCEQILDWLQENYPLNYTEMDGHYKYGCSISVMEDFIEMNE